MSVVNFSVTVLTVVLKVENLEKNFVMFIRGSLLGTAHKDLESKEEF